MKRILGFFRAEEGTPRRPPDGVDASVRRDLGADQDAEYTDGSQSYSYEQSVDAPQEKPTPSRGGAAETSAPAAAGDGAADAGRAADQVESERAADSNAVTRTRAHPEEESQQKSRTNGSSHTQRVADTGSESSRYSLRPRRKGVVVRDGSSKRNETLSTGSNTRRDMKRRGTALAPGNAKAPCEPKIALAAMPHAASARTTSGVVGRPGLFTTGDVEKATHSTLRQLCGELGIPAAGTKAELRERALQKISEQEFDGEEVQRLHSESRGSPKLADGGVGAAATAGAGTPAGETATTTTAVVRGNEVQRSGNGARGETNVVAASSTAELSSTALFKFEPTDDPARRQLFRGATPLARQHTGEHSTCHNPPAVTAAASACKPPLSQLPLAAMSGGRPPPAPPAPSTSPPPVDPRTPTATHLSGVRLDPVADTLRVDVPRPPDAMSPAGRQLPAIFAGAEGGPPNTSHTASAQPADAPLVAETHIAAPTRAAPPATPMRAAPAMPLGVRPSPPPALPPIRPLPRQTSQGLMSPGHVLKAFNSAPSAPPLGTPSSVAASPPPAFRSGGRPASERFPRTTMATSGNRRSMRLPFRDARFSPVRSARKRHSTGMSSFQGAQGALGGQLNDLRASVKWGSADPGAAAPPLGALNHLQQPKPRDSAAARPMTQTSRKILAAIRRTAQENRVLCRPKRPMPPIGPPPSLKRPRDDEDVPRRPGKRPRPVGNASATPVSKPAPPAARGGVTPVRENSSDAVQLQSAPPGTIVGARRRPKPPAESSTPPSRDGLLRGKSTASIRKRRLAPRGDEGSAMKSPFKRRSLAGGAASDLLRRSIAKQLAEDGPAASAPASAPASASSAPASAAAAPASASASRPPARRRSVGFREPVENVRIFGRDTPIAPAAAQEPGPSDAPAPSASAAPSIPVVALDEEETVAAEPQESDAQKTFTEPEAPAAPAPFIFKPPAATPSEAAPATQSTGSLSFGTFGNQSTPPKTTELPTVAAPSNATPPTEKPPAFSFGAPSSAAAIASSAPTFGAPASSVAKESSSSAAAATPTATFGAPASTPAISFAAPASTPAVSFGAPASTPAVSFGTPASTPAFSFGASSAAPTEKAAAPEADPESEKAGEETPASAATATAPAAPALTFGAPTEKAGDSAPSAPAAQSASGLSFGSFGQQSTPAKTTTALPSLAAPSSAAPATEKEDDKPAALPFGALPSASNAASPAPSFGAAPSAAVFGTPSSSAPFGASSSAAVFGAPSSAATFGSAPSAVPASTTPSFSAPAFSFGGSSSASTAFGASSSAAASFGASSSGDLAFGASSSVPAAFEAPSTSGAADKSEPFGAPSGSFGMQSTQSKFGSQSTAGFGFGSQAASEPAFSAQPTAAPSSGGSAPFGAFGTPQVTKTNPFDSGSGAGGPFGGFGNSINLGASSASTAPFMFDATPAAAPVPFSQGNAGPFQAPTGGFGSSGGNAFGGNAPNRSGPFGNMDGGFGTGGATPGGGGFGSGPPASGGGFGSGAPASGGGFGANAGGGFGMSNEFGGNNSGGFAASTPFGSAPQPNNSSGGGMFPVNNSMGGFGQQQQVQQFSHQFLSGNNSNTFNLGLNNTNNNQQPAARGRRRLRAKRFNRGG